MPGYCRTPGSYPNVRAVRTPGSDGTSGLCRVREFRSTARALPACTASGHPGLPGSLDPISHSAPLSAGA